MANGIQTIADKVVQRFKEELSSQALSSLTDADFERLAGLVRVAVSEDREETSAQLDALAKKLKADIEHVDLNL